MPGDSVGKRPANPVDDAGGVPHVLSHDLDDDPAVLPRIDGVERDGDRVGELTMLGSDVPAVDSVECDEPVVGGQQCRLPVRVARCARSRVHGFDAQHPRTMGTQRQSLQDNGFREIIRRQEKEDIIFRELARVEAAFAPAAPGKAQ